ncbi:MAG: hypothetical protein ACI4GO_04500, partial [Hominenteromicrobium sp.]
EKAGDVLLADTSPAHQVSVFAAIFVPCLLLARSLRSQAQHNPGTRRTPKGLINPAKQRPKTG